MRLYSSRVAGTGAAFPERVVTNAELCEWLDHIAGEKPDGFSPDWILERTGIETRHLARAGETTSELAFLASVRAVMAAGVTEKEIDGIILATCTPEQPMPASATLLQMKLGAASAFAVDVNAACSGFQHAWAMAHAMIASGQARTMLVVGADVLSAITDYSERKSAIIFGDGAGAMILTRDENLENSPHFTLAAEGREWDLLQVPAGGSSKPLFGIDPRDRNELRYSETRMQMKGPEIFKSSVRAMCELSSKLLEAHGLTASDIDFVVPHQANLRILEMVSRKMKIPMEKFVLNIATRGNTSAATVPTALDEGIRSGRLKPGHRLLIPVFGAGTTAGSSIVRL